MINLEPPQRNPDVARIALLWFSVLWALHVQLHFASSQNWFVSLPVIACVTASLFLLLRPTSSARLLLSLVTYCVAWFDRLPAASNHFAIGSFVAVPLAASIIVAWQSRPAPQTTIPPLYLRFAPVARAVLIVMYFWAVFHKLNYDFLGSPDVTCTAMFYDGFRDRFSVLPQAAAWLRLAMAWGAVAVEAGIPLLLIFRHTRIAGIMVGWSFHFMLALNPVSGFYNFTSLLFPLFLCFAPAEFFTQIGGSTSWLKLRAAALRLAASDRWACVGRGLLRALLAATGIVVIAAFVSETQGRSLSLEALPAAVFLTLWLSFSLPLSVIVFEALVRNRGSHQMIGRNSDVPRWLWGVPLLFFVWGATPYLGLKTENSLSMFSNLRTESNPNHLLIRDQIKIFDFQDDPITVLSFSRGGNDQLVRDRSMAIPFGSLASRIPDERVDGVTFLRAGSIETVTRAENPELFEQSLWSRKFMTFRSFTPDGDMPCVH